MHYSALVAVRAEGGIAELVCRTVRRPHSKFGAGAADFDRRKIEAQKVAQRERKVFPKDGERRVDWLDLAWRRAEDMVIEGDTPHMLIAGDQMVQLRERMPYSSFLGFQQECLMAR